MAIYGIDLGTTFCSVAFVHGGHPRVAKLDDGGNTLASVVRLETDRDGAIRATVGARARTRASSAGGAAATQPGALTIRGSKNFVGVRDSVMGGPPWSVASRELYATDVASLILRALGERVRGAPDLPPMESVVVTHPQRFRNGEKLATAQSVKLAGFELAGMITEPDAAAWAYGLYERAQTGASGAFMVFDFGGGTLDVTIMERTDGAGGRAAIRAIGSYGVQLGGLQLDERIRDGLVAKYRAESGDTGFDLDGADDDTRERLLELAESFKIDLNRAAGHDPQPMLRARRKLFEPRRHDGSRGAEAHLKVTLGELSSWIAGEIDRAVACAEEALSRSGVKWNDLSDVLLTGGSSQLLALQQRMRERCGARVLAVFDDEDHPLRPSTIVAVGASLYGASLAAAARGDHAMMEVRGVVPDSFSVRAFKPDAEQPDGRRAVLHTLVEAGTPTPFVGRSHFTMRGGGRVLPVEMYEGRAEAEASPIGTFRLEFDRDVPDGARVEVQLRVGSSGAIVLAVRNDATGAYREAALNDAPGLFSDAELEERRGWLQSVRIDTG